jgi:hypothetical protein
MPDKELETMIDSLVLIDTRLGEMVQARQFEGFEDTVGRARWDLDSAVEILRSVLGEQSGAEDS